MFLFLFSEWVEFNPFEIGMPKYGTFMKTELFGSKFFMGKLCTEYEEQPLHFLQGITSYIDDGFSLIHNIQRISDI